eukprot:3428503-Prymnesium_polylepis.2
MQSTATWDSRGIACTTASTRAQAADRVAHAGQEADDGRNDDDHVQHIEALSQVGARVHEEAASDHLDEELGGEDDGKDVLHHEQNLVEYGVGVVVAATSRRVDQRDAQRVHQDATQDEWLEHGVARGLVQLEPHRVGGREDSQRPVIEVRGLANLDAMILVGVGTPFFGRARLLARQGAHAFPAIHAPLRDAGQLPRRPATRCGDARRRAWRWHILRRRA